jgi:Mrp family chromosome partitioning ATPase
VVDKMIVPPVRGDLKLMSIGFFLEENAPVMWRGPMLHRALEQFLSDVHWGELDTLVVDMPPGTGDVSISLGQLLPRAEAVIVTTPQPLAQEVAARAALMARKTNMRLLGVVENMSGEAFGSGGGERLADELQVPLLGQLLPRAEVVVVTTPQAAAQQVAVRAAQMANKTGMRLIGAIENMSYLVGSGQELFGAGGGEALAQAIDAPLLGKVPLDPRLRESADAGEPLVWAEPENETARTIVEVAEAVMATGHEPGTVKKPLPLAT